MKIPEYKACAATVERLDTPEPLQPGEPKVNFTAASSPAMFPYEVGESRLAPATAGDPHGH
jgi:assimilatory nitrate reductase catalytic subunit